MRTKQKYILKRILFTVGAFVDFSLVFYFFTANILTMYELPNAVSNILNNTLAVLLFIPSWLSSPTSDMTAINYTLGILVVIVLCAIFAVAMWIFFRKETKLYARIILTVIPLIAYCNFIFMMGGYVNDGYIIGCVMSIIMLALAVVTVLAAVKYPKYIKSVD